MEQILAHDLGGVPIRGGDTKGRENRGPVFRHRAVHYLDQTLSRKCFPLSGGIPLECGESMVGGRDDELCCPTIAG